MRSLAILVALTGCVPAHRHVGGVSRRADEVTDPMPAESTALDPRLADLPTPQRIASSVALPAIRLPGDLRALVGRRSKRDPLVTVLDWARALTRRIPDVANGPELVAWAERERRLVSGTATVISPGDLVVFDRARSGRASDLVAVAIGRDGRGVVELIYLGGGVVRRGFVDPSRPHLRRGADGEVVNTYLRHGKRWPPKGTRYLTGELIAHVIR